MNVQAQPAGTALHNRERTQRTVLRLARHGDDVLPPQPARVAPPEDRAAEERRQLAEAVRQLAQASRQLAEAVR